VVKDVKAAIVQLTFESQPLDMSVDEKVKVTSEELQQKARSNPRWRDLFKFDSPRSIYAVLKRLREDSEK